MIYCRPSLCPWQVPQKDILPELFVMGEPLEKLTLREDQRIIAYAAVYRSRDNGTAIIFRMEKGETETLLGHALSITANHVISSLHPSRILLSCSDPRMKKCAKLAMFFPKGRLWQRNVESWRYLVPDLCFDHEGYLIDQGKMKPLPFGWFSTREKGCGWIAAYNLLKLNGREQTMQETAEGLGRWGLAGEYFGENFFRLLLYIMRRGLKVKTAFGKKSAISLMKKSRSGILLYSHGKGSHYCSYRVRSDGSCYFYNVIYGMQSYVQTPEGFFDRHGKGWKVMLIGVC